MSGRDRIDDTKAAAEFAEIIERWEKDTLAEIEQHGAEQLVSMLLESVTPPDAGR